MASHADRDARRDVNPDCAKGRSRSAGAEPLDIQGTFYPEKRPFFIEGDALFRRTDPGAIRTDGRLPDPPPSRWRDVTRRAGFRSRLWSAAKSSARYGSATNADRACFDRADRRESGETMTGSAVTRRIRTRGSAYARCGEARLGASADMWARFAPRSAGRFETPRVTRWSARGGLCPDVQPVAPARAARTTMVASLERGLALAVVCYIVEGDVAARPCAVGPPRIQRDGVVIAAATAHRRASLQRPRGQRSVLEAVLEAMAAVRRHDAAISSAQTSSTAT